MCGLEAQLTRRLLEGRHVYLIVYVFDLACTGRQQGGRVSRLQLAHNFCIDLQARSIKPRRAWSALRALKYNARVNTVYPKCLCGISGVCVCVFGLLCGLVCSSCWPPFCPSR